MEPKTFRLSWRDGVYRVSDPTLPDECTCLRIEDHDAEIAAINAKLAAAEARIWRLQREAYYVDAYDPAIVEAIAIADAAREAGLVKDGKLMPMIGKLQVTADNCVILDREVAIHLPMVNGDVYTASAGCAARMDHWYANREAAMEASKAESSARSAAEAAAKGATDAQG